MPASNTRACFSEFVGQKVVGVLFDALPPNRRDIAAGTKALIFEDGRALLIASNGSYWIESSKDVEWAVEERQRDLRATEEEIRGVLELAGAESEVAALPPAPPISPDQRDATREDI